MKALVLSWLIFLAGLPAASQPPTRADSGYVLGREGFIVVEAEDLPHSEKATPRHPFNRTHDQPRSR